MRKMSSAGIAFTALLLVSAGADAQSANANDPSMDTNIQRGLAKAAQADQVSPQSVEDVSGTFRVEGIVRKKTSDITSCSCTVYFYHDNLVGGDYYTYGSKSFTGKNCNMKVPFRFPKGDTGRPVTVNMTMTCTGGNPYRYYNADLDDIPLQNGKSKKVTFDIDM